MEKIDDCHITSRCHNYIGGYICSCMPGFRKNKFGICEGSELVILI